MDTTAESLMDSGNIFFPAAINQMAGESDWLFFFIFYASMLTFAALIVATIYFLRTGRAKSGKKHVTHNNFVEITWTVIPTIIVMFIFYWGFQDFLKMKTPPAGAYEIRVTGEKWKWRFEYPNGTRTVSELVVPVNRPVKLIMSSRDVIHSFYLPNLRMKRDVIPNRYTTIWIQPEKVGNYTIFCTEYCGDDHSNMLATLIVKPQNEFNEWLASGGGANDDMPLDQLGKKVYTQQGCNACHNLGGGTGVGPSWKGIYGSKRTMADGSSVTADDNYLRESIEDPAKKVVKGYAPVMPTYKGLISDREINALIEYIKTIK